MDWEQIKPVLWGAVGGAIVLAIVGFNWGGWVTGGAAMAMAKETAATAVAERLGTICVAQFNRDTTKSQKLLEMKDKDTWEKGRYIDRVGRSCRATRRPRAGFPMPVPSSCRRRANCYG